MGLQFPRRRAPLGAVWARLHAQCKFPRHPRGKNPPAASDPTKTADLGRFGVIWGHQGPPNVKPARLIPRWGAPRHRGGARRPCCYAAAARRRVGAIQWSKMAILAHFRPFLALAGYESPSYRQPRTWQTCRVAQVCLWRAHCTQFSGAGPAMHVKACCTETLLPQQPAKYTTRRQPSIILWTVPGNEARLCTE